MQLKMDPASIERRKKAAAKRSADTRAALEALLRASQERKAWLDASEAKREAWLAAHPDAK